MIQPPLEREANVGFPLKAASSAVSVFDPKRKFRSKGIRSAATSATVQVYVRSLVNGSGSQLPAPTPCSGCPSNCNEADEHHRPARWLGDGGSLEAERGVERASIRNVGSDA